MKLLGRRKNDGGSPGDGGDDAPGVTDSVVAAKPAASATAPKGRPTPKRATKGRGRVAPAPMTAAQARARRKAMAGPKLSIEERRARGAARRARMTDRRNRMLAGEEGYLLPRDQGPVRGFVRDVVDARRNMLGLFMPSAMAFMLVPFAVPRLQAYMSSAMMALTALMAIDAIVLGRKVIKLVDEKFPKNTERHAKLGFYAAARAFQVRRLRAPRPQVKRGTSVA